MKKQDSRPDFRKKHYGRDRNEPAATGYWLHGKHPVLMALNNPARVIKRVVCTKNAYHMLQEKLTKSKFESLNIDMLEPQKIDKLLGNRNDITHQGIAAEVEPLEQYELADFVNAKLLVATDKITDPHNIGAIMRSCAAFGAAALITQEKNSPPENATIAKTSAGGIELVPYIRVGSLWKTVEYFKEHGFQIIGLDGTGKGELTPVGDIKTMLVIGSEGAGLSDNVIEKCDVIAKISIKPEIESLNASVAAAIALYELNREF